MDVLIDSLFEFPICSRDCIRLRTNTNVTTELGFCQRLVSYLVTLVPTIERLAPLLLVTTWVLLYINHGHNAGMNFPTPKWKSYICWIKLIRAVTEMRALEVFTFYY